MESIFCLGSCQCEEWYQILEDILGCSCKLYCQLMCSTACQIWGTTSSTLFWQKKSAMLRHALPHQNCWWLKVMCSFLMNILFGDVVGDEADVWFVCFFVLSFFAGDTPNKKYHPKNEVPNRSGSKRRIRLVRWFEAATGSWCETCDR